MARKGQNRLTDSPSDFSLPRSKILRGKRNFQRLFDKSTVLRSPSLQFRFRVYENPSENCLVGFIAPKRQFKRAVDRNRMKRLLREAYRLNQHILTPLFDKKVFGFHAALVAQKNPGSFNDTEAEVIELLHQAREKVEQYLDTPPLTENKKQ